MIKNEESQAEDIEKIDEAGEVLQKEYEFTSKDCQYKQRGPYLVCVRCELQHALYIGMDKMMTGEDENGRPILTKRTI